MTKVLVLVCETVVQLHCRLDIKLLLLALTYSEKVLPSKSFESKMRNELFFAPETSRSGS